VSEGVSWEQPVSTRLFGSGKQSAMKSFAFWILESVSATIILVVCLGIPGVLELPGWTTALSIFPIWLYLTWRLDRPVVNWLFAVVFAGLLAALLALEFLVVPERWHPEARVAIVAFAVSLAASKARRKRFSHAEQA
jgi:hypothetical protein